MEGRTRERYEWGPRCRRSVRERKEEEEERITGKWETEEGHFPMYSNSVGYFSQIFAAELDVA